LFVASDAEERRSRVNEKVLIVDDEPTVRDVVGRYLRADGFQTLIAGDGTEALELGSDADLVVLDLMLPGVNGYEVCRRLRAACNVPIVMLTAKRTHVDRIIGLQLGADDYVVKPFNPRELVARVRAVLRRAAPQPQLDHILHVGDLRINLQTRTVEHGTEQLNLTSREFDLLAFLARHPLQVFSREQLLDQVWDYHSGNGETSVTALVCRLREKIEPDPLQPRYVKTVWGVGYKLQA
jgi:DNA-binding response OmpR family regulator